jgi:hypothetical protein
MAVIARATGREAERRFVVRAARIADRGGIRHSLSDRSRLAQDAARMLATEGNGPASWPVTMRRG